MIQFTAIIRGRKDVKSNKNKTINTSLESIRKSQVGMMAGQHDTQL